MTLEVDRPILMEPLNCVKKSTKVSDSVWNMGTLSEVLWRASQNLSGKLSLVVVATHWTSDNIRRRLKVAVSLDISTDAESDQDQLQRWLEANRGQFLGR